MRSHCGAAKIKAETTLLLRGLWRGRRQQQRQRQNNPLEAPQGAFNLARPLRHELKIKSIAQLPHGISQEFMATLSRNGALRAVKTFAFSGIRNGALPGI